MSRSRRARVVFPLDEHPDKPTTIALRSDMASDAAAGWLGCDEGVDESGEDFERVGLSISSGDCERRLTACCSLEVRSGFLSAKSNRNDAPRWTREVLP